MVSTMHKHKQQSKKARSPLAVLAALQERERLRWATISANIILILVEIERKGMLLYSHSKSGDGAKRHAPL